MVSVKGFVLSVLTAVAVAKSAVIDLTPKNFDDVVLKSGKPTLVEFFAPWCGHCKTLAPVYEELATSLEYAKDKVQIAKVDADAEKSLGKRFGIQGFPTLKYFDGKSESPQDYNSGRDIESLTSFIVEKTGLKSKKKQAAPSQVEVLNDRSLHEAIGKDKNVLVAFTAPWCGHCKKLAPTWETLAADFANDANVVIAKVDAESADSKAVVAEYGVTGYPTIKFFPAGSETPESYDQGRGEEELIKFVNLKAGTHRLAGGELDGDAGTVEVLNDIVVKLTSPDKLAELATEVASQAASLKDAAQVKYAEYYIRVFEKLKNSDNFAATEVARLDGILSRGGLAPSKRDEIRAKANVLRRFVTALGEKVAAVKDEL